MATAPGTDSITQLVNTIIEAAGADSLPEEAKQPFRETLEAQVMRRLGIIILQNLDEQGVQAYEELLARSAKPTPAEMQALLEKHLPDYEAKIKAGMQEFLQDIGTALQSEAKA